jgi:endonuclease/exonuclease/phosphatase family metal-dependent hydrolase
MKKLLKISGLILSLVIFLFALFILIIVFTDYKPDHEIVLQSNEKDSLINDTSSISILSWNIGYCGLDKDMDFFFDGGVKMRTTRDKVLNNLSAVNEYLISNTETDIFLLQEVDIKSRRSYYTDQFELLDKALPQYNSVPGINYDVLFVPSPINNPMGRTLSGLMTMSKYKPKDVIRYSYKGNFSFPMGLFMPDRCFLVSRYRVVNGKELLIINTHNSAFDDGTLRSKQLKQLKDFVLSEYEKGNYVIIGGDWNQCPPDIETIIPGWIFDYNDFIKIDMNMMPENWYWVFNNDIPTNRRLITAFSKDKSPVTIIDFFLISPNVICSHVENIDLGFIHSDHNPVRAVFRMKRF